jgi:hypothetical protein
MLNAVSSHAGEKSLVDVKSSMMTFLSLSAISPDAQVVQEKYLAPIQARIDSGDCPPGLRKQYEMQLEQIRAQTPSHEIILFPGIGWLLGERDRFGNPRSSPYPYQQFPILIKNMHLFCVCRIIPFLVVLLCTSIPPHCERIL